MSQGLTDNRVFRACGNWFADVLYTYRPAGAFYVGQVENPDLSGMPDLPA